MWISHQDEALQAHSVALIAVLITLFGYIVKRNQFWFSFLCLSAMAVLVAAIVVADLGT
jgi:hypothetical protein